VRNTASTASHGNLRDAWKTGWRAVAEFYCLFTKRAPNPARLSSKKESRRDSHQRLYRRDSQYRIRLATAARYRS
jgi:hypothetical protein